MKKIMLGLVAAFALTSFAAPVFAEEGAAETPKKEKKAKKGKKADKGGEATPAEGEKK